MQAGLRRTVAKWVTFVLFGLLIASFALWGIGDIFRGGATGSAVIQVGDSEVDEAEFSRTFQRELNRVRQQLGGDLDLETAKQMGLVDQIVRQIITRELFSEQARSMGLLVSDATLARFIREQPAFRNDLGQFDRTVYESTLRRNGLSEARYVELLRSDIHREHLVNAATGGLAVPDELARSIYRYRNEKRVAEYVEVPRDRFQVEEPSESDLRAFHEANGERFMAPAYRELTLIRIRIADLMDEVQVTEAQLREAFENSRGELGQPERRSLAQTILDDDETAQRLVEQVRQGADFTAAVEEVSGFAPVELGFNTRDDLLAELAEPVFALAEGEVSAPIETALGWHVVKVREVQEGHEPSFEEVRDRLREDLARDDAVDSLVSLANRLDDALAAGATLEEAADTLGLPTRHIPAIDQQGNDPDGEAVEDLPEEETFLQVAFDTPAGEQSLLNETTEDGYFVLRVDSVTPAQRRPFAEVREQVRQAWLRDQRQQQAEKLAETLAAAVRDGTSLAQAARTNGLQPRTSVPLGRRGGERASPQARAIADALFDAELGEPVRAETDKGTVVGVLAEIQPADPASNQSGVDALRQELAGSMRSDILAQFADSLRQSHAVRVNQTRLEQVVNRFQ